MIYNFPQIRKLLNFKDPGDFYFIEILGISDLVNIKTYHIYSISEFEKILKTIGKNHLNSLPIEVVKFLLSFEYMKTQRLIEAFDYYDYGFDKNIQSSGRFPRRHFSKPLWNGDLTPGARILIWGEQGIGDQIMFMSCLKEITTTLL